MPKLKITWVKSSIGHEKDQRRTMFTLGLHKLHQSVVRDDSASLRGQINKVRHLVMVEESSDQAE